jgi:cyclopropane fatty-acyl-phospholipid synthase-like methyltransferase
MRHWIRKQELKVYFKMDFLLIYLLIIIFAVIALVFLKKIWGFAYPYFFWGAVNVPTTELKVEEMVELLKVESGQTVVDMGAGDGRLIIALAKVGAKSCGYEINPFLVAKAKKNIKEAGLGGRVFIYCKSMWRQDLSNFDAVVVYGMTHMMKKLEKKLDKELKPGARVVSNYFVLPTWKPCKVEDNIYLYIKK